MVKFQFPYLQAGTVNHKILHFNETHKKQTISSTLIEKNNWLAGDG